MGHCRNGDQPITSRGSDAVTEGESTVEGGSFARATFDLLTPPGGNNLQETGNVSKCEVLKTVGEGVVGPACAVSDWIGVTKFYSFTSRGEFGSRHFDRS